MSIFKIKRKGKKEFMKYEDGKIIPVQVEEHKNYKEFNINSANREEEVDIKTIIKEKVDVEGKVKKYGTWKTLKIASAIAIIVFFGFTVKDVYVAFTEDGGTKTVEETPKDTPSDKPNINDNVPNETPSQNGSYQSGSGDINSIPPLPTDNDKEQTPSDDKDKSPLKMAVDTSNMINDMLVSETNKDIGNLNQYFDNKLNKFSFEKKLKASIDTKENLAMYLSERKELFKDENILNFYSATEERINNSIQLTQSILASFTDNVSNEELIATVNGYIEKENTLKEKQNQVFIKLLKEKKIPYQYNEEKGEIQYTIK